MQENQCKDCENYMQHYALNKRKLFRVYCGHCTCFPAKRKRPDTAACELFRPGVPDAEAFASKEYLSKELLQYLLQLELLPPIHDQEWLTFSSLFRRQIAAAARIRKCRGYLVIARSEATRQSPGT